MALFPCNEAEFGQLTRTIRQLLQATGVAGNHASVSSSITNAFKWAVVALNIADYNLRGYIEQLTSPVVESAVLADATSAAVQARAADLVGA